MKKNLLSIVAMVLFSPLALFATNSINPTTMPSTAVVGSTESLTIEYESDVTCNLGIAIFQSKVNSDEVDWSTWTKSMSVSDLAATSGTPGVVNIDFEIGSIPLSSDLEEGRKYIWCFDLSAADGSGGLVWNNSGATNELTVTSPTTITNYIHFAPNTVSMKQGETLAIDFDYIIEQDSKFKVSITHFTTSWSWIGEITSATSDALTTNTDANTVAGSVSITIPASTTPTADLVSEMYRFNIIMLNASDNSEVMNIGRSFTVTTGTFTDVSDNKTNDISVFPNPVINILTIKGITTNTIANIISLCGNVVMSTPISSASNTVDVTNLATGVYFVRFNNTSIKFIKQ